MTKAAMNRGKELGITFGKKITGIPNHANKKVAIKSCQVPQNVH